MQAFSGGARVPGSRVMYSRHIGFAKPSGKGKGGGGGGGGQRNHLLGCTSL